MSLFEDLLVGQPIQAAYADSEVIYIMLANGTQMTIRGVVMVEPCRVTLASTGTESLASS